MALMTTVLSFASSSNALGQCNNITAVQTEGSCTRHFTFSSKLTANIKFALSYSFDFGDGHVLTGSFMSITSAFAPTHYDPNLGFYRTSGQYNDVYHYYCNPGQTYTYTIDIVYIDATGITKTFHCTDSFVFDPFYGGCSCNTSGECNFTMTNSSNCANTSISFEGMDYAVLYTHEYWFNDDLVHSSVNPDWTFDVENFDNCNDIEVRYMVKDANGDIVCETSKPLDLAKGLYIGNHNCTPVYLSDLITDGILPANTYSASCDIYVTGEVVIDQNYVFEGTMFHFDSGAGLTVGNSLTGNSSFDLTLKGAHLSSCAELWRGIRVYQGTSLTVLGSTIEDALYAIRPMKTPNEPAGLVIPSIKMNSNILNNNYIGFFAVDGRFDLSVFKDNTFNGGTIKANDGGTCGDLVNEIEGNDNLRIPLTQHSYAGMFVDGIPWYMQPKVEGAVLNLQGIGQNNQFNQLVTGINARSGNHYITGCNFFGIDYFDYPVTPILTPEIGFGVNFTDATGMSLFRVDGGEFLYCRHGVNGIAYGGNSALLYVDNTYMLRVKDGISQNSSHNGGFKIGYFTGNNINNSWPDPDNQNKVGIFVKDFDSEHTNVHLTKNTINGLSNYPNEWTNAIWMMSSQAAQLDGFVGGGPSIGNTIDLQSAGEGILLENITGALWVSDNQINVTRTGWGPDDGEKRAAIRNWGVSGNNENSPLIIKCNTIEDMTPNQGYSIGYAQSGRTFTTVETNSVQNTNVGLTFQAMCQNAIIYQNKIGADNANQMDIGLHYIYATTGAQINRGNRWRGSFGGWGALAVGFASNYFVNNTDNQMPPSVSPTGWFIPISQNTTEKFCPEGLIDPGVVSAFSTEDYAFMSGQLTYSHAGLDWDMRSQLLSKVLDSTDLLNDPIVQNFYADPVNQEVLVALDLAQANKDVFSISESDQTTLSAYENQIRFLLSNLDELDSLLKVNPTDGSLLNNYILTENQISMLRQVRKNFWDDLMTQKEAAATAVLAQYSAFSPTSVPGQNTKTANMVFLKMQGLGESLTGSEIDELSTIASMCPEEGGSVVHLASTIYSANTRIPLPIAQCAKGKSEKVKLNNSSSQADAYQDVSLFPNPGMDELIISVKTDEAYRILIQSIEGKVLISQESNDNQNRINTADLSDGLYIVRIISDDGVINSTQRWLKSSK